MLFGASYKCSTHQNCKRGLLGNCFNECYLLSKRQAVISFILKQKHTRKKEKEKKKKSIGEYVFLVTKVKNLKNIAAGVSFPVTVPGSSSIGPEAPCATRCRGTCGDGLGLEILCSFTSAGWLLSKCSPVVSFPPHIHVHQESGRRKNGFCRYFLHELGRLSVCLSAEHSS